MTFRNFSSAVLLALPLGLSGVSAHAGEVVDAAAAVEAAIAAGDFNAWQAANATLLDIAWVQPGLHFNRLLLTSGTAVGYGSYEVRPDNVYAVGEKIFVYAEPEGFGFGELGNGKLEIAFDIDLRVLDGSGALLVEAPNFMQLQYQTAGKVHEFLANMTVELGDTPAGQYTLEFIFHDRHNGQSASFTTDIVVQ
jgi:hypothetical protein